MSSSAHERLLEDLGRRIVVGELAIGTVVTAEALERSSGASRSVVREAVRSLSSMGLVQARQRVGVRVLQESSWNLFDARVIRWRLGSPRAAEQVAALREVRLAIEPEAARLAATRADPPLVGRLMSSAGALWSQSVDGDAQAFAEHDAEFHRLVLQASGNAMFAQLSAVIGEALRERAQHQPRLEPVDLDEIQLHLDLAHHVQGRRSQQAWEVAREIVVRGGNTDHG